MGWHVVLTAKHPPPQMPDLLGPIKSNCAVHICKVMLFRVAKGCAQRSEQALSAYQN